MDQKHFDLSEYTGIKKEKPETYPTLSNCQHEQCQTLTDWDDKTLASTRDRKAC